MRKSGGLGVICEIRELRKNQYSHIDRTVQSGQIDLIIGAGNSQLSAGLEDGRRQRVQGGTGCQTGVVPSVASLESGNSRLRPWHGNRLGVPSLRHSGYAKP